MGNIFSSIINLTSSSDLYSNQSNHNNENNIIQNNIIEEKKIPYSYIPNSSDDIDEKNDKNKSKLKCIRIIKGHYKWCNCLILLKSNNLCSCSGDKSINIYSNDNNFDVILTLPSCHDDFILYMIELFESVIASSSSDGTIKFWKIFLKSNNVKDNNYYLIQTIKGHESDAWKILFINDTNQLISCGSDALIKIWSLNYIPKNCETEKDIINYTELKILTEHKYWVSSIIQVKNEEKKINYLVSSSGDTTVKFYDINKNYIFIHTIYKVLCCQQGTLVNYDNKRFLIGGGRGIFFYIVNFINFQVETKIYSGNEEVNTILVLKNNKFIYNGGFLVGGKECCFYYIYENFYTHKKIKQNAHEKYIYCLIQLGEDLIASSSYDNVIKIWKYDEHTFD